jgi:alpha-D-ribose 1-methylphosphonate 5-triphosphate synthase subunit PhnG
MVKKLSRPVLILPLILSRPDDIRMNHLLATQLALRPDWLRVLACGAADQLLSLCGPVLADYPFEWLREPEVGLMMVRARIGNTGDRFNLGEATVTRCAVRHRSSRGEWVAGVGHVMGRDPEKAGQIAKLDALLQLPALHELLWREVVQPLRLATDMRQQAERDRTEASRVRFFTLQPEVA